MESNGSAIKWSWPERLWLRFNEYAGAKLANHLIADHPVIKQHLLRCAPDEKITVIPYGALPVETVNLQFLGKGSLRPESYALVIARPEPDNSILEIVSAFSRRPRGIKLVVLGKYDRNVPYQRQVLDSAGDEVQFMGAIYEKPLVETLRKCALIYLHGHKVGGTNPSLVEALAAGNAIIAHDNPFTRWVAGPGARFFVKESDLDATLGEVIGNPKVISDMRAATGKRFTQEFHLDFVLKQYESLLQQITDQKSNSERKGPHQSLLLRDTTATQKALVHRSLQLCQIIQDPSAPHTLRSHLQILDLRP